MKKLALIATVCIVLAVLVSPTSVMGSPARIEEPSFEALDSYWSYSETDTEYDGNLSTGEWVTQGTYSYKFSSTLVITVNTYCQIAQSGVNFDLLDTITFDAYLWSESLDYFKASVFVGTTEVWTKTCSTTATAYPREKVDVSTYTGIQSLIFRITCLKSPSTSKDQANYFDNIKLWGSHSDDTWTTVENTFSGSTNHVYMYGENFDSGTTKVGYYDGGNALRETDTFSGFGGGILSGSECLFTDYAGVATEGTWHAVVLLQADDLPDTYAGAIADPDYIADDAFYVDASAIPEFPTIFAGIGVAGLCFGIYYWMRKRKPNNESQRLW